MNKQLLVRLFPSFFLFFFVALWSVGFDASVKFGEKWCPSFVFFSAKANRQHKTLDCYLTSKYCFFFFPSRISFFFLLYVNVYCFQNTLVGLHYLCSHINVYNWTWMNHRFFSSSLFFYHRPLTTFRRLIQRYLLFLFTICSSVLSSSFSFFLFFFLSGTSRSTF